jgi:hypothetical protein
MDGHLSPMRRLGPMLRRPCCTFLSQLLLLAVARAPAVDDSPREACTGHDVIGRLAPHCWFSWCFDLTGCTVLQIEVEHLGDDGAEALASALRDEDARARLTTLRLRGNGIGDSGAAAIASAAAGLLQLATFELRGNHAGPASATQFARVLTASDSLTSLDLSNNHLGVEGARVLASALSGTRALSTLRLGGNRLGDEGARALAEAVSRIEAPRDTLRALGLSANGIRDAGVAALRTAVELHHHLTGARRSAPVTHSLTFLLACLLLGSHRCV